MSHQALTKKVCYSFYVPHFIFINTNSLDSRLKLRIICQFNVIYFVYVTLIIIVIIIIIIDCVTEEFELKVFAKNYVKIVF